jgi:hypothetical protein
MLPPRLSTSRPNFQALLSFTCLSVAGALLLCVGILLGPGVELWRLGALEWYTLGAMLLFLLVALPLGVTSAVLAFKRRCFVTGDSVRLISHLACCIKAVCGVLCLLVAADAYPDAFGYALGRTPVAAVGVVSMLMLWSAYRFYGLYREAKECL